MMYRMVQKLTQAVLTTLIAVAVALVFHALFYYFFDTLGGML